MQRYFKRIVIKQLCAGQNVAHPESKWLELLFCRLRILLLEFDEIYENILMTCVSKVFLQKVMLHIKGEKCFLDIIDVLSNDQNALPCSYQL